MSRKHLDSGTLFSIATFCLIGGGMLAVLGLAFALASR